MFTPETVVQKVKIGMTRDEVKAALGEPTDISIGSRKYPRPCVWKYGDVELYFHYPKDGGVWKAQIKSVRHIEENIIPEVLMRETNENRRTNS